MKKWLIIAGALFALVALFAISLVVLAPPKPIIDIKGESLVMIHSFGSDAIDIKITNTLFTAWVAMALLLAFCFFATRKRAMIPSGLYNFFEAIIELLDDFIRSIAGPHNARRFFPVVATFILYIVFANWLSLTPLFNAIGIFEPLSPEAAEFHRSDVVFKDSGGIALIVPHAKSIDVKADECKTLAYDAAEECRAEAIHKAIEGKVKEGEKVGVLAPFLRGINTDLMTPMSFALVSAFFVEMWGISSLGFFPYMRKFVNFRGPIDVFVGFLELIAELARIISFSFRLFGNMMAGEILLLVMTFLFALTVPIAFYFLEMFVGMIQAFVFGTLTLVFAVLAVSAHGGDDHHSEAEHS